MQKITNDPDTVVDDALEGFLLANKGRVERTDNERVTKALGVPRKGKVGIVTGGGSGHKPAFVGYVGPNMVDAVAVGELFSSPPAMMFYDAFKAADSGSGVACLYGNYAGDNMNVAMAIEMASADGIDVRKVVANDDVASAPEFEREKRRGVAGEIFMWKVGAAKAAQGGSLSEVITVAQKAIDRTRSIGVGTSPCVIPEVGKPNFTIEPGTMELGIGHHGEPGVEVTALEPSKKIADRLLSALLSDLPFKKGNEVAVLVSGLGSTPALEQFIFYRDVHRALTSAGIKIYRSFVGQFFTSLEMGGLTLSLIQLDEELKACLDLEADCWGLSLWGGSGS